MSQQPEDKVKEFALQTVDQLYKNLLDFIRKFQLNSQLQNHAFQNLDQGMYWLRLAIASMPLESEQKVELTPELDKAIKEGKVIDVPVNNDASSDAA